MIRIWYDPIVLQSCLFLLRNGDSDLRPHFIGYRDDEQP
jgi:hypothetical protein